MVGVKAKMNQTLCVVILGNERAQKRSQMLISKGITIENMSIPPSVGCVISV